jgi:hypothetical protein
MPEVGSCKATAKDSLLPQEEKGNCAISFETGDCVSSVGKMQAPSATPFAGDGGMMADLVEQFA